MSVTPSIRFTSNRDVTMSVPCKAEGQRGTIELTDRADPKKNPIDIIRLQCESPQQDAVLYAEQASGKQCAPKGTDTCYARFASSAAAKTQLKTAGVSAAELEQQALGLRATAQEALKVMQGVLRGEPAYGSVRVREASGLGQRRVFNFNFAHKGHTRTFKLSTRRNILQHVSLEWGGARVSFDRGTKEHQMLERAWNEFREFNIFPSDQVD